MNDMADGGDSFHLDDLFDLEMQGSILGQGAAPDQALPAKQTQGLKSDFEDSIRETLTVPLEKYPRGYPLVAAFQSSQPCWSIYRRFDYLHSRVILELQDELRDLEEKLANMDQDDLDTDKVEEHRSLTSRASDIKRWKRRNRGENRPRAILLNTIREKLVKYDEIQAHVRERNAFLRPSTRDYRSLRRFYENEKPISNEMEEEYIKRKEDLLSLHHGREWARFDGLVEDGIKRIPIEAIRRLFTTPELRSKTDSEYIHFYAPDRVENLVGLIITSVIFTLLVLPVFSMYKLTSIGDRTSTLHAIGILIVFTLMFSAAMSLLTGAKRHELFAASAAYCAVLVVFISNFNGQDKDVGKRKND